MGVILLPSLMPFFDVCLDPCAESMSDMIVANNNAIGTSGILGFLPPHSVDEYIRHWSLRLDAHRLAIFATGSALVAMVGHLDRETAFSDWW